MQNEMKTPDYSAYFQAVNTAQTPASEMPHMHVPLATAPAPVKQKGHPVRTFFKTTFACLLVAGIGVSMLSNIYLYRQLEDLKSQNRHNELIPSATADISSAKSKSSLAEAENVSHAINAGMSTQEIVKRAIPAVVAVRTEIEVNSFFGRDKLSGSGSGVIIDKEGYIVTNYHVIENSVNIEVQVAADDKKKYKAELVAGDSRSDLAVLKIVGSHGNFPYIELADSDKIEIGEKAIAIGNPLGDLDGTVTQGIISGSGREVYTKSAISGKLTRLENILQTDASINEGNSGGALLNDQGQLIGINTAKVASRDGVAVEGIGFAIPSNTVKSIIGELLDKGYVSGRPQMGVRVTDVTEANSQVYGMPVGAYIVAVDKDSAADHAGLRRHDIITKLDGESVNSVTTLNALKDRYKAGDSVKIEIWRQGEYMTVELTFGEAKPEIKSTTPPETTPAPTSEEAKETNETKETTLATKPEA